MRRLDVKPIAALTAVALFVGVGLASCTQSDAVVLREVPTPPAAFSPADASADAAPDAESVAMCAVTTCSLPWATCPSSEFPCDVDLLNDDDNCGGCGIRCGGTNVGNSKWTCVEGQCAFSCALAGWRNCDNKPTNGCETDTTQDTSNCGACGRKCKTGETCWDGKCSDPCELQQLPDRCDGTCTNLQSDDRNCGTCGTRCDPTGPGLPALPADMYYGCVQGECGNSKCTNPSKSNCNADVTDGCEATLKTDDHCTSCGDACPSDKVCAYDPRIGDVRCICLDGETRCGFVCRRLDDDPLNCGGCNYVCPGNNRPHFVATCTFGACGGKCEDNYADCDGIGDNGCESNTRVDTRNCGACGNACAPNQVCSAGKCLVAPCESEGPTTK